MRARSRLVVSLALATVVIGAGLVAPASADDPPPPVWDALPSSSTVTADYRIDFFLGTTIYNNFTGQELADPAPVFTFEIENYSAVPLTFGLGMDLDVAGDIEPWWHPETFAALGDGFDLSSSFVLTVAPGQVYSGITGDAQLALPAWTGRTIGVYEVTQVDAEPPATGMVTTDGPLLAQWTLPGRFVPVRFGDTRGFWDVGIGSPTSVSAPDGDLFPGVTATVTAENLVAGDQLDMYLVDNYDYFWFYLTMSALTADAIPVGTGTVAADGTFTGTFVVPPDTPLSDNYQLLLGDADENYWPAGGYEYFAITEPDAAASAPTGDGASTTQLSFQSTAVSFAFPAGTVGGTTSAAVSTTGPAVGEFTFASDPTLYYHLDTTAVPGGPVTVCISYDTANIPGSPPYLYHHDPVPPNGYRWTNITTSRVPGLVCGVTTSFSPFTLGYPLHDGSTVVPAKGVLSSDNGWDTGLQDGAYNITMNIWNGENARIVRLLENGSVVGETELTRNSPNAQQTAFPLTGRVNGTYVYTAELINSTGTTTTKAITVKVTDANPGKPVLSDNNSDKDGNYVVTADMWWGTNATSYTFRENGVIVGSGSLTGATPNAQKATLTVSGRPKATYTYTVTFTNAAGETTSATRTIKVTK